MNRYVQRAKMPQKWTLQTVFELDGSDARLQTLDMSPSRKLIQQCVEETQPFLEYRKVLVYGKWHQQSRRTCFMGRTGVVGYEYSGQLTEAVSLTPGMRKLLNLLNDKFHSNYNGVLINHYPAGKDSAIGFHSDNETGLGPGGAVLAISFGGSRVFRLKDTRGDTPKTVWDHATNNCELMAMVGSDFQKHLVHGIPKRVNAPERYSITLRVHAMKKEKPISMWAVFAPLFGWEASQARFVDEWWAGRVPAVFAKTREQVVTDMGRAFCRVFGVDFWTHVAAFRATESQVTPTENAAGSLPHLVSAIFGWPLFVVKGSTHAMERFRVAPQDVWSRVLNRKNFCCQDALQLVKVDVFCHCVSPLFESLLAERSVSKSMVQSCDEER